jgi:hypothetical protein
MPDKGSGDKEKWRKRRERKEKGITIDACIGS